MAKIVTSRSIRLPFRSLYLAGADFLIWWLEQVRALLPSRDTEPPTEIIFSKRGFSMDGVDFSPMSNDESGPAYTTNPDAAKRTGVIAVLAPELFLVRTLSTRRLPDSRMHAEAELDLLSQTPFSPDAVIILVPRQQSEGSLYAIVKRTVADQIGAFLLTISLPVEQVSLRAERGDLILPPRALGLPAAGRGRTVMATAVVIGLVALLTCFLLVDWKTSAALEAVKTDIQNLTPAVKSAKSRYELRRTAVSKLVALQKWQSESSSIASLLAELTRLLPDTAYLTEVDFRDGVLSITGFAKSPAELISLIESSHFLMNVRFTAPVVRIPGFDSDRFVISCEVERS